MLLGVLRNDVVILQKMMFWCVAPKTFDVTPIIRKSKLNKHISLIIEPEGELKLYEQYVLNKAQKMKFCINDSFSKCDQVRSFLWIWLHLLNIFLLESFIFCAMQVDRCTEDPLKFP